VTNDRPWHLADLSFAPSGNGRERATINGVEVVRENGRYWPRLAPHRCDGHDFRHPLPASRAGEEVSVFAVWCGKLHQGQMHQHSLCSIIFILQRMSK
jgi:hypothetical protein